MFFDGDNLKVKKNEVGEYMLNTSDKFYLLKPYKSTKPLFKAVFNVEKKIYRDGNRTPSMTKKR